MKIYNKLVRDNIPRIIKESGKKAVCSRLDDNEYLEALNSKLQEECLEYRKDKDIEELADILEVIYAIAQAKGISVSELEKIRIEKAQKNGAFTQKILLESVEDQ
ncbi:MAG: nucleoside triphosphate pyrophosphohydrolase [Oscillospiraceae bacterium]|nr:nucleoside triphosphate pyrophosphohydrolase [Oscillospiraceae bacterium]